MGMTDEFCPFPANLKWMIESELATESVPIVDAERTIEGVMDEVHRYALFRLSVREDAEDASMETLHALHRHPQAILSADDPRRFAIGVCRRKVADILRRRRWRFWQKEPPVASPKDPDRQMMVARTLAGLTDDQRDVLALKYFHEFTAAEIAELTGKTTAAVNSLLQRAREAFAEAAKDWYEEESQ